MKKTKVCKICNKKFESCWTRAKYCSVECKSQSNKNRYREKPNSVIWHELMEFCNERDNYQCTKCGSDKNLCVHHIRFLCDGGTNNPDNLVTLCAVCHVVEHQI